ncbi:MAG: DUF2950 family protein [Planctomycetes bacterium]|nr:DUF2950 family protein [Planctomycetota bacterium]
MTESRAKKVGIPLAVAGAVIVAVIVLVVWLMKPSYGVPKSWVNEKAAVGALKEAIVAEEILRENDHDGNGAKDYWTGDWSGLHRLADKEGKPVALINALVAGADAEPLPESRSAPPSLGAALERKPKSGYWFRALRRKDGEDLQRDGPDPDTKAWEHPTAYAFAAWPAEHGKDGLRTFVVCEDGQVWSKDLGAGGGENLREWPAPKGTDLKSLGWTAE